MFEIYRAWYEPALGMSISDWIWADFRRDALPYVMIVPVLFWLLGRASARWKRLDWLAGGLTIVVAMLIAHIVKQA